MYRFSFPPEIWAKIVIKYFRQTFEVDRGDGGVMHKIEKFSENPLSFAQKWVRNYTNK